MRLVEMNVYPLKSGRGTGLSSGELTPRGLRHDREFMLITPDGEFLSQRRLPRMALLRPDFDGTILTVAAPGVEPLVHKAVDNLVEPRDVTVQRKPCQGVDQGDEAAEWFGGFLGIRCRLVKFTGRRPTRRGDGEVGFADGYPLLVISRESLDDLNARLDTSLPMNRFRPSLVVEGLGPYGEDDVRLLRVGDAVIEIVKPCTRCVLTTVDQETAAKGHEPLKTLASYRNINAAILFGQNAIPRALGTLRVGDPIEVLDHKPVTETP